MLPCAHALAGQNVGRGADSAQNIGRLSHAAAAGGGERDHGLAGEIVAFKKRFDDARRLIPPDREADEHGAVLRHILHAARNGRAAVLILHLERAAALLVHPVQIGGGVRRLGTDLKKVAAGHGGERFRKLARFTAGGEIRDQNFIHREAPP